MRGGKAGVGVDMRLINLEQREALPIVLDPRSLSCPSVCRLMDIRDHEEPTSAWWGSSV